MRVQTITRRFLRDILKLPYSDYSAASLRPGFCTIDLLTIDIEPEPWNLLVDFSNVASKNNDGVTSSTHSGMGHATHANAIIIVHPTP